MLLLCGSLAPCRSYSTGQMLPNNVFERSYPCREFDLAKRIISFFHKASHLCMVGFTAGAAQGAMSNFCASKKEGRYATFLGNGCFTILHRYCFVEHLSPFIHCPYLARTPIFLKLNFGYHYAFWQVICFNPYCEFQCSWLRGFPWFVCELPLSAVVWNRSCNDQLFRCCWSATIFQFSVEVCISLPPVSVNNTVIQWK